MIKENAFLAKEKVSLNKGALIGACFISFFITFCSLPLVQQFAICPFVKWRVEKGVSTYVYQASIAANADLMLENLEQAKKGMQDWGATDGYSAFVFKTEEDNLGAYYQQICSFIKRLQAIKNLKIPSYSKEYNLTLIDIRKSLQPMVGNLKEKVGYRRMIKLSIITCVFIFVMGVLISYEWLSKL